MLDMIDPSFRGSVGAVADRTCSPGGTSVPAADARSTSLASWKVDETLNDLPRADGTGGQVTVFVEPKDAGSAAVVDVLAGFQQGNGAGEFVGADTDRLTGRVGHEAQVVANRGTVCGIGGCCGEREQIGVVVALLDVRSAGVLAGRLKGRRELVVGRARLGSVHALERLDADLVEHRSVTSCRR